MGQEDVLIAGHCSVGHVCGDAGRGKGGYVMLLYARYVSRSLMMWVMGER